MFTYLKTFAHKGCKINALFFFGESLPLPFGGLVLGRNYTFSLHSRLLFMLYQKPNLVLRAHSEYFKIEGVQKATIKKSCNLETLNLLMCVDSSIQAKKKIDGVCPIDNRPSTD